MPLPVIGTFLLSAVGSMLGKALWQAWQSRDGGTTAAAGRAEAGAAPFANVLQEQNQRYAQAPGATATDLSAAGAPLPVATAHFARVTARAGSPMFKLNDIQTG
jgi:hypothetical protein